jgi:hypothetical protein
MIQSPRVRTTVIWLGDKGRLPHQIEAPPVTYKLDGSGHAFTRLSESIIFLTNERRILRIDTLNKRITVCPMVAPERSSFVGITNTGDTLYALLDGEGSTQMVVLDQAGRLIEQFPIGEPTEQGTLRVKKIPPVWVVVSPAKTILTFSFAHDIEDNPYPFVLCEFYLTGTLKQKWEGITGVAIDKKGTLYVSGLPERVAGLQTVLPPRKLDQKSWRLVGIDKRKRLYWHRNDRFNDESITTGWIACSTADGTLQWQIKLSGTDGVLARHDSHLEVYLGFGGGWIEVSWEGAIYVLADNRKKIQGGVGIYKIEVLD